MKYVVLVLALVTGVAFAQMQSADSENAKNIVLSGRLNHAKGVDIPSAHNVDLNSVAGNLVHVTGASTILSFGTASQAGIQRVVIFDGVNTLTHNASTLVLPGASTIATAAGDSALVVADSTTKWLILNYQRKATAIAP